jgi:uncharacterized membrane protein
MYQSITKNLKLMGDARHALSGKWLFAIIMFVVLAIYQVGAQAIPFLGSIIVFLFAGSVGVGYNRFSLAISRGATPEAGIVLSGFKNFATNTIAFVLMFVFVLLWMLLLVIPGIVKAYAYSQTLYILANHPNKTAIEAITKSRELMHGNKLKLFGLSLYMLGLAILCVLTLGIGFIWLMPYKNIVFARFYDDLQPAQDVSEVEYISTE